MFANQRTFVTSSEISSNPANRRRIVFSYRKESSGWPRAACTKVTPTAMLTVKAKAPVATLRYFTGRMGDICDRM
jgi:hypothetical protein